MEALFKPVSGAVAALAALFAPIGPLAGCLMTFIAVDFLTGVAADCVAARRAGRRWYFESRLAWRTVSKAALTITALALLWLMECFLLETPGLSLARLFAGFTCSVELWSFLENASQLADTPVFRWLRRCVRRRIRKEVGDE